MGVVLLCFVAFTTFVWLFGTTMANWISKAFEEDSNEIIYRSQASAEEGIYPRRQWAGSRRGQTTRSYQTADPQLSVTRRHAAPLRTV